MSLDRTPSPQPQGGWGSPGLSDPLDEAPTRSPGKSYGQLNGGPRSVTWASAKARSAKVAGFSTQGQGFFQRHLRQLSTSLPAFHVQPGSPYYAEKEKLQRGRWPLDKLPPSVLNVLAVLLSALRRFRRPVLIFATLLFCYMMFYATSLHMIYRRSSWFGGGNKFVIILGANPGGGVNEWKGPREWAIERDSIRNKKRYAARHGYGLEIVDMATKKRYAHEWRESWEKVDVIKRCLQEYPEAEWFWWLDLNTFIMEPSYSLQTHIFDDLAKNTYRDINYHNPLNISHPITLNYIDDISSSLDGDGDVDSIDLLIPQDCAGFNLGSFFVRRSPWLERLLDIWWDPVHYEQKHMQWEHKEQDSLEYLYGSQPWIRPHTAFLHQRVANSFPPGACGPLNTSIHYHRQDRDFLVNMAGCEWGRDCWGEMYHFRELSNYLNRTPWEKFKDGIRDFFKMIGRQFQAEKPSTADATVQQAAQKAAQQ